MLGSAPGTDRLNDWVDDLDDDMSVEDLANHIEDSDDFQDEYPAFMTDGEFAEAFMGNLLGDYATADVSAMVVEAVEGLLGAGHSRGEVALVVVTAMLAIAAEGESHDLYEALGMASTAFHNKVMVAEHYTVMARMADPSASVLEGVTADTDSAMMAIDAIDNPPAPPEPPPEPDTAQRFVLTPTIDDVMGGDADDTIVAQPVAQVSNVFQETLNPFDSIDGGGGVDTIHIFGVDPDDMLSLGAEDIMNVENVVINTVGGINADLTDWAGVEMVDLRRFGDESDVTVIVDDGATVSSSRTFGGTVMIAGASGTVDIEASDSSMVHIGSAGQTESVMVEGGASVTIAKNLDGSGQSESVTSVSSTGVALNAGNEVMEPSGTFAPLTNTNGFLVGQDGSTQVGVDITPSTGDDAISPVGLAADGLTLTNPVNTTGVGTGNPVGSPILATYSWDDDGDASADSPTAALEVNVQLKFDQDNGGLVFGDIVSIGGTSFAPNADPAVTEIEVRANTDNAKTYKADALDGMRVPASVAFTTQDIGKEDADPVATTVGAMPTLSIHSNAIEDVHLNKTDAIVKVMNDSKTATGGAMPEDLSVTVDGYGSLHSWGKLCVTGSGSAETITIDVAGASAFRLASDEVKTLNISGDARLVLEANKFDNETVSDTLATVTVSGAGGVAMDKLQGSKKLASIDASMSSGTNSFKSSAELAALTMVMGGTGGDTVDLSTSLRGKLASVDTGDGNDTVMIDGDYRDGGLMVDLGAGDDTFHGGPGNGMSRVDGGDGRDTLRLSGDGDTYKDGEKTMSIYSNFEVLDVGGGSGRYDVGRLGVDTIVANKTTTGVTLNNVSGGTALDVSAEKAGMGTSATVTYNFADDVNVAGSIIDGGTTNILNVSLMARGGDGDSKKGESGKADLMITLDEDLLAMTIDSGASVHRTAAGKGVTSGHYMNKVMVGDTASALEEVKITGNAMTELGGTGLTSLQYVNATESGAGVVVDASANADRDADVGNGLEAVTATRVRLAGSNHDDNLTAGGFDAAGVTARNVLMGNGGDDILTGGVGRDLLNGGAGADELDGGDGDTAAEDRFIYNAASDSQVTFSRNKDNPNVYDAKGYDVIMDFDSTSADGSTDKLHLSKSLEAIFKAGGVKGIDEWGGGATDGTAGGLVGGGWKPVDNDGTPGGDSTATIRIDGDGSGRTVAQGDETEGTPDAGAANLFDFIGDGRGLFLTRVEGQPNDFGHSTVSVKNSVALIAQDTGKVGTDDAGDGLWLLVDVDADGNFDADTDMVIFLDGVVTAAGFDATTDLSS